MTDGLGWRERGALLAGRAAGAATRRLGQGGGTALPGLVATTLAPGIAGALAGRAGAGRVVVTGTNGKTTTCHLLAAIASAAGLDPIANRSGSNLERGIVSAFVDAGDGHEASRRLGVLEVDEAALPGLLPALRPDVAVFLNLFRDQLDRYGEVDSIAEGWDRMLLADGSGLALALNADDPSVAGLAEAGRGAVVTFGIEDRSVALEVEEHAADARFCTCGSPYRLDAVFVGHVGHWRCENCGRARPRPEVAAHEVEMDGEGTRCVLEVAGERRELALPLAGLYPVYNALAAAAAAHALGLSLDAIVEGLASAGPAFGRQERFRLHGRELRVWLAKNPVGLNVVMRALAAGVEEGGPGLHLLLALNDGVQDGRDTSWIYDADPELLRGRVASLVVSGHRADDMALRCALAGLRVDLVQAHLASALEEAVARTPAGGRLEIVPTYTAMLDVREVVASGAGLPPYWETTPVEAKELAS